MNWRQYITIDPKVCHGHPIMKGTRIPVSVVLDNAAEGHSHESIIKSYPSLTSEHIFAALMYAAELSREQYVEVAV